jgi:hypothetical protein
VEAALIALGEKTPAKESGTHQNAERGAMDGLKIIGAYSEPIGQPLRFDFARNY